MSVRGTWWLTLTLLTGCPKSEAPKPVPAATEAADTKDEAHADEPAHEELPTRVRLSAEVVEAARVRTAPVTREVLEMSVTLPGEIVPDPDKSARVSSPVAGRIERVGFREGKAVKAGDVLAIIRVPDLGRLRSEYAARLAKAKAARSNATRLRSLLDQRLTAEQTYLDAVAEADALEAEGRASAEQLTALGLKGEGATSSALTLRAPLSGIVVSRSAVIGQPVTAEEVIADIVELSELWFLGRVFEKDLGRLHIGARSDVQLNAYPKEHFQGVVEYIGRQVDPVARTVTARIRLTNRDDLLRVGLFGTAQVATQEIEAKPAALVVPVSALTEIAGKQVVFVRQADEDFELHELVLGASAPGKVEVVTGLREGEQVVVEGVFTLKSAVLKSTFAEEE